MLWSKWETHAFPTPIWSKTDCVSVYPGNVSQARQVLQLQDPEDCEEGDLIFYEEIGAPDRV